jgi:hypothetical protein
MRQLTGPRNPGRKRGLRKINRRVLTGELTTYCYGTFVRSPYIDILS